MRQSTERILQESGWRPGRIQDISDILLNLEKKGYQISDPIENFLREFNGIVITFKRNNRDDRIWFDARRASELADPEWIEHYANRLKALLVPVGFSNHEHLMLMESADGGFYGGFDDFVCGLGVNVDEMIGNLTNQDQEPLI